MKNRTRLWQKSPRAASWRVWSAKKLSTVPGAGIQVAAGAPRAKKPTLRISATVTRRELTCVNKSWRFKRHSGERLVYMRAWQHPRLCSLRVHWRGSGRLGPTRQSRSVTSVGLLDALLIETGQQGSALDASSSTDYGMRVIMPDADNKERKRNMSKLLVSFPYDRQLGPEQLKDRVDSTVRDDLEQIAKWHRGHKPRSEDAKVWRKKAAKVLFGTYPNIQVLGEGGAYMVLKAFLDGYGMDSGELREIKEEVAQAAKAVQLNGPQPPTQATTATPSVNTAVLMQLAVALKELSTQLKEQHQQQAQQVKELSTQLKEQHQELIETLKAECKQVRNTAWQIHNKRMGVEDVKFS